MLTCWCVSIERSQRLCQSRCFILSARRTTLGSSIQAFRLFDKQQGILSPYGFFFLHSTYGAYLWLILVVTFECGYQHNHLHRLIKFQTHSGESASCDSSTVTSCPIFSDLLCFMLSIFSSKAIFLITVFPRYISCSFLKRLLRGHTLERLLVAFLPMREL